MAVPPAAEIEALLARHAPGHPHLPQYNPRIDRVSVPRLSLGPLYLVQPLMVSHLLAPATAWHMMHDKADAMGMTQKVAPFLDWLRAATLDPLQGIDALTRVDLADATLEQRQGISTSLVPHPNLHRPRYSISRFSSPSSCKSCPHRHPPQGRW